MKELLEKYNKLSDEDKDELEDLYILHQLMKIERNRHLGLSNLEIKIIFEKIKSCLRFSNINCKELISRLLGILNCVDITICKIDDIDIDELLELLSKEEKDFKETNIKKKILGAIKLGRFYCVLAKNNEKYFLICEKDDGTQYMKTFKDIDDLIKYLVKKFLPEEGEYFV